MTGPRTHRLQVPTRPRAFVRIGLVFVGIFFLMLAGHGVLELALTPWARSFGLWPTLTGEWFGELRRPDGTTAPIFVALEGGFRVTSGGGHDRTYLEGRARVCERAGVVTDYSLHGQPEGWRGRTFTLEASLTTSPPPATRLGDLAGEWTGDSMRLAGAEVSTAPTQTAVATRSPNSEATPAARYELRAIHELRRGTEADFLDACRKP